MRVLCYHDRIMQNNQLRNGLIIIVLTAAITVTVIALATLWSMKAPRRDEVADATPVSVVADPTDGKSDEGKSDQMFMPTVSVGTQASPSALLDEGRGSRNYNESSIVARLQEEYEHRFLKDNVVIDGNEARISNRTLGVPLVDWIMPAELFSTGWSQMVSINNPMMLAANFSVKRGIVQDAESGNISLKVFGGQQSSLFADTKNTSPRFTSLPTCADGATLGQRQAAAIFIAHYPLITNDNPCRLVEKVTDMKQSVPSFDHEFYQLTSAATLSINTDYPEGGANFYGDFPPAVITVKPSDEKNVLAWLNEGHYILVESSYWGTMKRKEQGSDAAAPFVKIVARIYHDIARSELATDGCDYGGCF